MGPSWGVKRLKGRPGIWRFGPRPTWAPQTWTQRSLPLAGEASRCRHPLHPQRNSPGPAAERETTTSRHNLGGLRKRLSNRCQTFTASVVMRTANPRKARCRRPFFLSLGILDFRRERDTAAADPLYAVRCSDIVLFFRDVALAAPKQRAAPFRETYLVTADKLYETNCKRSTGCHQLRNIKKAKTRHNATD